MVRVAVLLALFLLAACRGEIYCGHTEPGNAIDPRRASTEMTCYDAPGMCATCRPVADPRWHCVALSGSKDDPMTGSTLCWPSLQTCNASRPMEIATQCTARESVYCLAHDHVLVCHATEKDCNMARDLAVSATNVDPGACFRR